MNRLNRQKPINYILACLTQLMVGGLHLSTAIGMFSKTKNVSGSSVFVSAIIKVSSPKLFVPVLVVEGLLKILSCR